VIAKKLVVDNETMATKVVTSYKLMIKSVGLGLLGSMGKAIRVRGVMT
jgi:hypothetical protein